MGEPPDVPNVYPSSTETGQTTFAGGDDTCACVSENLAACSYACCPAGTFSTRPDICVGANCAFPLDSGSAANFPSDCPCANKNVFYNMQEYTIDEDLLASWAGYDVILKIADEQTGDDGFVAVDNIKFHGKPLTCVELTGTGSPDWTAYSDSDALADPADTDSGPATDAYPAGGFGNNQGWSRITDPDGTYGYAAGTSSNCRMSSFNSVGDA